MRYLHSAGWNSKVSPCCLNSGNCSVYSTQQLFLSSLGLRRFSADPYSTLSAVAPSRCSVLKAPIVLASPNASLWSSSRLSFSTWLPPPLFSEAGDCRTYLTCLSLSAGLTGLLCLWSHCLKAGSVICFVQLSSPHCRTANSWYTSCSFVASSRSHR